MESESDPQHELDSLRIRQIVLGRRATMRLGSYCFVGAVACAIAAIELVRRAARGTPVLLAAYFVLAAVCAWGMMKFLAKARGLRREARAAALPEPGTPPDFSNLSDGSHIVRNLEEIQ